MLRGSRSGEDISEVSSWFIRNEQKPSLIVCNISSLVIDDLCDGRCEEGIAIAMFYCDFHDQREQTTTNIMGAILRQLVVREEVLGGVRKAFQKAKEEVGGRYLRLSDIV